MPLNCHQACFVVKVQHGNFSGSEGENSNSLLPL
jgi:hypothetical protein